MIVVPSLSKANQGNPPEILGIVASGMATISPTVGGAIHQPGRVEQQASTDAYSPDQPRKAQPANHRAKQKYHPSKRRWQDAVITLQEAQHRIASQIWHITPVMKWIIK